MFTEIRAGNFKSWASLVPDGPEFLAAQLDHAGLPLGRVTGLFGANSSGKTSILQVLLLLKQTVESADRRSPLDLGDVRSPIRLGTFNDVLRNHDERARLVLGLSWKVNNPLTIRDPVNPDNLLFTADNFSFDTEIAGVRSAMIVRSFRYQAGVNQVSYGFLNTTDPGYALTAIINGDRRYLKRRLPGRKWDLPVTNYGVRPS